MEEQFKTLGYYYERKKNQYQDKPKNERLDCELLGQLSLAYYLGMASEAKNTKSLVFGDKYDAIFDENVVSADRLLLPYKLYKPLESQKKAIQKRIRKREQVPDNVAFISRATFHILTAIKTIAERQSLDLNQVKDAKKATKSAIKWIYQVVRRQMKTRKIYTHDKFFKEVQTNQLIYDHIQTKTE